LILNEKNARLPSPLSEVKMTKGWEGSHLTSSGVWCLPPHPRNRGAILPWTLDGKGQQACPWRVLDGSGRPTAFLRSFTNHYASSTAFFSLRTWRDC